MIKNILFLLLAFTTLSCDIIPRPTIIRTDSISNLYANGKYLEAKQGCEILLGYKQTRIFANELLGLMEMNEQNYEDARNYLEAAVKLNPNKAENHLFLGITHFKIKELSVAEKYLQTAASMDSTDYRPFFYLGRLQASSYRMEEAEQSYDKAIALTDKYPESKETVARVYEFRALLFKSMKRFRETIADYTSIIKLLPDDSHTYYLRGLIYFALGDPEKACQDYRMAAETGSKEAQSLMGTCYDARTYEERIM